MSTTILRSKDCCTHSLLHAQQDALTQYKQVYVFIVIFILTVNYNTFCFATIAKVFYLVVSVLTTCFGPYYAQQDANPYN
jgi:hypothetical protein